MLDTKVNKNIFLPKTITLSTCFTLARIALIPCIIYGMLIHEWGAACILFSIAAITDVIDGALARFLQEETPLGAYLDPVADKLLLGSCYITLAFVDSPLFKIPRWFVVVVMLKELLLVLGALYVSFVKHAVSIRPTWLGKLTAAVQVIFIWWLFICAFLHWMPVSTFYFFLYTITVLTLGALFHYTYIGYKGLIS